MDVHRFRQLADRLSKYTIVVMKNWCIAKRNGNTVKTSLKLAKQESKFFAQHVIHVRQGFRITQIT